jgi:predicted metal-dependent peptidase
MDASAVQRVRRELERAVCELLCDGGAVFYAHVLMRMGRDVSDEVDTMAVGMRGDRLVLFVNPGFWDSLAAHPQRRVGVLIHEVLHVVLRHLERARHVRDHELFNVATDLAVNEIVGADRLPEGALLIERMPPELELEPGAMAEDHYDRLERARRERGATPPEFGGSGPGAASRGRHDRWPGEGGSVQPGELPSEAEVRGAINEIVQAAARETLAARGTIPGALARAVRAATPKRARTDWRTMLRLFGTSGTSTYLKPTIMSPSRRFGTVPGVRIRQRQSLAVVIDTSGSIGDAELEAFFREIHALWRLGVEVTVIECDAAVSDGGVWKYTGHRRREPEGGGGTDFDPAIRYANTKPFDGVVYLTDGFGSRTVASRWRMLWMLTTDPDSLDANARPWRPRETVCRMAIDDD